MAKRLDSRVSELEKRSGGGSDAPSIIVTRADGSALIDGELISQEELELRYPGATIIRVGIDLERV